MTLRRKRRLSRRRLRHHDRTEKFSPSFNVNLRRKQMPPGKLQKLARREAST